MSTKKVYSCLKCHVAKPELTITNRICKECSKSNRKIGRANSSSPRTNSSPNGYMNGD